METGEEREWFTIDRIEGDGRRVYGSGAMEKDRALAYIAARPEDGAAMADAGWYRLRSLGTCTHEEALERKEEPQLAPLGRMPEPLD